LEFNFAGTQLRKVETMKVQIIATGKEVATGKVLDLPRHPVLQALADCGLIKYLPDPASAPPPKLYPQTTWKLVTSPNSSSKELFVHASCASCGEQRSFYNPTGKRGFSHCGVTESIPEEILRQGRRQWEADIKNRAEIKEFLAKKAANEPSRLTPGRRID
jgi:hypothetical protein